MWKYQLSIIITRKSIKVDNNSMSWSILYIFCSIYVFIEKREFIGSKTSYLKNDFYQMKSEHKYHAIFFINKTDFTYGNKKSFFHFISFWLRLFSRLNTDWGLLPIFWKWIYGDGFQKCSYLSSFWILFYLSEISHFCKPFDTDAIYVSN